MQNCPITLRGLTRFVGIVSVVVASTRAGAQQLSKISGEDPRSSRFITVIQLTDLPLNQRAVVYIRPQRFPAVLVVVRSGDGTPEDLAAGYEAAASLVDSRHPMRQDRKGAELVQTRLVLGPSQVRQLSPIRHKAFAHFMEDLSQAKILTIDGIGTGPLLRISKRVTNTGGSGGRTPTKK